MRYETSYRWSGEHDRGETTVSGHAPLPVGGPVGEDHYSAEHLLVATAEICLANTFFFLAARSGLEVASYTSTAKGELEYVPKEGFRFERIAWERFSIYRRSAPVFAGPHDLANLHLICNITRHYDRLPAPIPRDDPLPCSRRVPRSRRDWPAPVG